MRRSGSPPTHVLVPILLAVVGLVVLSASAAPPCRIEVVEKGAGWPVPLVEFKTTHNVRLVTDNAGLIALDLPEVMGRKTWFDVQGNGYEVPRDGFGFRGVRITPEPGATIRIEVERTIIAKRLGRLTGAGIFAESQKLGGDADWRESGVTGCDSIQTTVHRGRKFWLWGDTGLFGYPLGVFHGTSATTAPRPLESFEPPVHLKFDYFNDPQSIPRAVAKMPGEGPTWVTGYVSLPDKDGKARLVGSYMKVRQPMEAYEWGLCVWNDETENFEQLRAVWSKSDAAPERPPMPDGHPAFWTDSKDRRWVLFGNPMPTLRCPATFEAWQDQKTWKKLKPQATVPCATESREIKPHSGSIAWNPWRKRWVAVFMEGFGKPSAFGELWYAEADKPTGPWGPAVKILSHENYTFYNPRIHAELTPEDSPVLLFEGTYTRQFSSAKEATARYDYNQILYRLDLDDPRLAPAQTTPTP